MRAESFFRLPSPSLATVSAGSLGTRIPIRKAAAMLRRAVSCLVLIALTLGLWACGGRASRQTGDEISDATVETVRQEPPLKDKFSNVLISQVSADQSVTADYPTVVQDLKSKLLSTLEARNQTAKKYKKTGMKDAAPLPGSTLLVEVTIPEMRIVSGASRFWVGAMSGSSYMNVHVRLTDAATGRLVHEKTVGSSASAFAAAYSGGANDRSLVNDMGEIVGEYLFTIIPGE
jgi:hypothetical protein